MRQPSPRIAVDAGCPRAWAGALRGAIPNDFNRDLDRPERVPGAGDLSKPRAQGRRDAATRRAMPVNYSTSRMHCAVPLACSRRLTPRVELQRIQIRERAQRVRSIAILWQFQRPLDSPLRDREFRNSYAQAMARQPMVQFDALLRQAHKRSVPQRAGGAQSRPKSYLDRETRQITPGQ